MKASLAFGLIFIMVGGSATQLEQTMSPIKSVMFIGARGNEKKSEGISVGEGNPLIAEFDDNTRSGRITNGSPAKLGDFPYQVYMISARGEGSSWLCGGSV
jgi:hypothetical protein